MSAIHENRVPAFTHADHTIQFVDFRGIVAFPPFRFKLVVLPESHSFHLLQQVCFVFVLDIIDFLVVDRQFDVLAGHHEFKPLVWQFVIHDLIVLFQLQNAFFVGRIVDHEFVVGETGFDFFELFVFVFGDELELSVWPIHFALGPVALLVLMQFVPVVFAEAVADVVPLAFVLVPRFLELLSVAFPLSLRPEAEVLVSRGPLVEAESSAFTVPLEPFVKPCVLVFVELESVEGVVILVT